MPVKYHYILRIIYLFIFFCFGIPVLAQDRNPEKLFRQMLHQPYYKKASNIREIHHWITSHPDSIVIKKISTILNRARQSDKEHQLEAGLLKAYYEDQFHKRPIAEIIPSIQTIAEEARENGIWNVRVQAIKRMAKMYWSHQRYERMFEIFYTLQKLLKQSSSDHRINKNTYIVLAGSAYSNIAEAHFFFKDYNRAIDILKKATALPSTKFNTRQMVRVWNNLGLCYQKTGELEKSSRYFKKIIDYQPQSDIQPLWKAIASGNLGLNYYLDGENEKAIPLLQYDIEKSLTAGIYGSAVGTLFTLINIRMEQNRLQDAGELIYQAEEYLNKASKDDQLNYRYALFKVMSKWHAAMGHSEQTLRYIDSTQTALKAHNDNFNSLKLMRARQKNNLQRRKMLMAKKQQQLQQRNWVIVIILLLFLGSLAAYLFRNRYLLRKQEVKELELENTSKELAHARTRLNNFACRVKQNNKLIARLKRNGASDSEKTEILREIKSSTLLTDEDWIEFKQLFEQVHPGYISRLKGAHPALTPAQIRFMVLVKLQFSRKEMANILGISPQSLRVTWYRIRKKLDLPKETQAAELAGKV